MDEHEDRNQPATFSPQRVGRTIPTSRRDQPLLDPPMLEELAPGPTPQEPGGEPPPPKDADPLPPSEPFDWLAPLHNRLIIGGISMLILLALTAVVLLVFSQGDGEPGTGPRVGVIGDDARTPTPGENLTAIALTTTTLRNGPNASFSPLGTVPRGARLPVIGRNADDTWLQVLYPPGSTIQGWIDITFLDVAGDLTDVEIAGPGSGPSIIVPTQVPTFVIEEPTDTPVPTDVPTDEPAETPEVTSTPLKGETPPPFGTPSSTATSEPPPEATEASPPTETPVDVPATPAPTKGKAEASADGLTAPATLVRRSQLSMLRSDVIRQVARHYRERSA